MQFNRTIQNYQKAYRKKVEGLKVELKSTRNEKAALQKQVKQLKSIYRVHVPSMAVGALIGIFAKSYIIPALNSILKKRKNKEASPADENEDGISTPEPSEAA